MTWSMATVTCTLECHANPELTEGVMWAVSSGHFFVIRRPHCTEAQEVTCVVTSRVLLTARVCSLLSHVRLSVTPLIITFQAPLSMNFPGKNTGIGCHFLLQGIFWTQGLNLRLQHGQAHSLPLCPLRSLNKHALFSGMSLFLNSLWL